MCGRRILLLESARLTVVLRVFLIAVDDLKFVPFVSLARGGEEQAAVPARLALAGDAGGNAIFEVELIAAEGLAGLDVAGLLRHRPNTARHRPERGRAVREPLPPTEPRDGDQDNRPPQENGR